MKQVEIQIQRAIQSLKKVRQQADLEIEALQALLPQRRVKRSKGELTDPVTGKVYKIKKN